MHASSVQDGMPADICAAVQEWERWAGAATYVMCVWRDPDRHAVLFEWVTLFLTLPSETSQTHTCSHASKQCGNFTKTAVADKIKDKFSGWMDEF
jgi:hypothetical protein